MSPLSLLRIAALPVFVTGLVVALAGCAGGVETFPVLTGESGHASAPTRFSMAGTVFGGQQPVVGAHVYVMAVTGNGVGVGSGSGLPSTTLLNSGQTGNLDSVGSYALTDANGGFAVSGDYVCPTSTAQVYLYVLGGNTGAGVNPSAGLLAAVGTCSGITANTRVAVNELSTIAAAYALAGFATSATDISVGASTIAQQGLQNAFLNAQQMVGLSSGQVLSATPNGNGAPDAKKIYTLGNILAACVNSTGGAGACQELFSYALRGGATGTVPTDTATAAIYIARHPFVSSTVTANLFNLQQPVGAPYTGLAQAPPDFSLGIRYTGGGLNAPKAVAIDASGDALVTNADGSVTQFSSTGVPSAGLGAGATTTQAVDGSQDAWSAAGTAGVVEQSSGSVTLSPSTGFSGGQVKTPTAVAVDGSGDVWVTNTTANGTDSVTELIGVATPVMTPIGAPNGSTPAPGVDPSQPATPEMLSQATVVRQLKLDAALYGHNMAINDCLAYVSLQNGSQTSKLAVVNVCGTDNHNVPLPVLVTTVPGSYPYMNGVTVNGSELYVTYGWATNPFEAWSLGAGGTTPTLQGCTPLFTDAGYTTCGATPNAGDTGAMYGGNPYVVGGYAYVAENSDDAGQAVQIVNASNPSKPVQSNPLGSGLGVSGGNSTGGGALAGLWAPGSGTLLYVGTNTVPGSEGQPVTITAYDAGQNALTPVKVGVSLNLPAGYLIQNMGVQGTTVVANLWNGVGGSAGLIVVASFANPNAPTMVQVAPTSGCVPGAGSFIAMQNGYAFFGCGSPGTLQTGIEVVSVANPTAPMLLGQIATSLTRVNYIVPEGRYLFATDIQGNFDTIDAGSLFVP